MSNNILRHHGILGQKWGVRRFQNKDGTLTDAGKKHKSENDDKEKKKEESKKTIKDMTNAELREKIDRIRLEQDYLKLANPVRVSKGKKFVEEVLDKAGKDIATQTAAYAMGSAVNKVAGEKIVDPKHIQKNKK